MYIEPRFAAPSYIPPNWAAYLDHDILLQNGSPILANLS